MLLNNSSYTGKSNRLIIMKLFKYAKISTSRKTDDLLLWAVNVLNASAKQNF